MGLIKESAKAPEPEESEDDTNTYFYRIVLRSGMPLIKPSDVAPAVMAGHWKHLRSKAEVISWLFDGWGTLANEIVDISEASAEEMEAFEKQYGGDDEDEDDAAEPAVGESAAPNAATTAAPVAEKEPAKAEATT